MSDPRDERLDILDGGDADAAAPETPAVPEERKAVKLLQGYLWHPIEDDIDLGDYLPQRIEPDIHVLWDAMPRAPFTFFDDGTLASTQQVYQFTVMALLDVEHDPEGMVPWLAEVLQAQLEKTPPGVGWQVMEDLREIG